MTASREARSRGVGRGQTFLFLEAFFRCGAAVDTDAERSRATLIATKTFLLPFFPELSTPSPCLVATAADSSCCYLRRDGSSGRVALPAAN